MIFRIIALQRNTVRAQPCSWRFFSLQACSTPNTAQAPVAQPHVRGWTQKLVRQQSFLENQLLLTLKGWLWVQSLSCRSPFWYTAFIEGVLICRRPPSDFFPFLVPNVFPLPAPGSRHFGFWAWQNVFFIWVSSKILRAQFTSPVLVRAIIGRKPDFGFSGFLFFLSFFSPKKSWFTSLDLYRSFSEHFCVFTASTQFRLPPTTWNPQIMGSSLFQLIQDFDKIIFLVSKLLIPSSRLIVWWFQFLSPNLWF